MASRNAMLRQDQANGREIVVLGGQINPDREDGRWPVKYEPRSRNDKSPWVRTMGFPFRHNSRELESIGTRESHARKATAAEIIAADKANRPNRQGLSEAYDCAEKALRSTGQLDPHWYAM